MPPMIKRNPSKSGMILPKRAKGGGELAAGGSTASITPAVRQGRALTRLPRPSIDGQPLLCGAKPRLGEVLRRSPPPEPGVVGRIENERWSVLLVDHLARENDL